MARLKCIAQVSEASGTINDDRIGQHGNLAWVIDGATDVLATRILPGGSDAAWFAEALAAVLSGLGDTGATPLSDVLSTVTEQVARSFREAASRPPRETHEHPSAAGILVRLRGNRLDFLSLADCQLILAAPGTAPVALGVDPELAAGDRRTVAGMRQFQAETGSQHWREARAHMLPMIRAARGRLNQPGGYGVFSVTPPPAEFIRQGSVDAPAGTRLLLATDGFTRLSDVFGRYRAVELIDEAGRRGLAALLAELRALEEGDAQCLAFPRTKPKDDASALLIEVA